MNVREINDTGPSIRSFVITALGMLLSSFGAWLVWRSCRNMKLAHEHGGLKYYLRYEWTWQKTIVAMTGMRAFDDRTIEDQRLFA